MVVAIAVAVHTVAAAILGFSAAAISAPDAAAGRIVASANIDDPHPAFIVQYFYLITVTLKLDVKNFAVALDRMEHLVQRKNLALVARAQRPILIQHFAEAILRESRNSAAKAGCEEKESENSG
jgi:hypothetical protein